MMQENLKTKAQLQNGPMWSPAHTSSPALAV